MLVTDRSSIHSVQSRVILKKTLETVVSLGEEFRVIHRSNFLQLMDSQMQEYNLYRGFNSSRLTVFSLKSSCYHKVFTYNGK